MAAGGLEYFSEPVCRGLISKIGELASVEIHAMLLTDFIENMGLVRIRDFIHLLTAARAGTEGW